MDREELERRRFSQDEVGELIETATRLDGLVGDRGLGLDDIRRIAAELGISDEALLEAVERRLDDERSERQAEQLQQEREEAKARKRRKQINDWKSHAASYVGVIGGLAVIDFVTSGAFEWFFYPAAGWGIGFLIHTFTILFGVEE